MALNLTQRRTMQTFQSGFFEKWKTDLRAVIGHDVELDIKWDDFFLGLEDSGEETVLSAWKQIYFDSLMGVFKAVCSDDMGKTAVKEGVKKIAIYPDRDKASSHNTAKLEGGVLTINHSPGSNAHHVDQRVKDWREVVETKL